MKTLLKVPQGISQLHRFPVKAKQQLQAWNAADEYLLEHIHEQSISARRILIINDAYGALTISLLKSAPDAFYSSINDSFLSQQGLQQNLKENSVNIFGEDGASHLEEVNTLQGDFDLVVIKIQKSLAQLEDQLHRIRPHIDNNTVIIAGGMVRMIHNSTLMLFENIIGPTTSSLAKKKSRLIFSQFDKAIMPPDNSFPSRYALPNRNKEILTHAGVFAQNGLDIGARFLIEHLPTEKKYQNIVDLACGNGVLGICAALLHPEANLYFCDESYLAVKSAEENFKTIITDGREAGFVTDDCLATYPDQHADLILNNPPFHQQNTIEYQLAETMFKQSFQALRKYGELWVVGNRHLAYHKKLKTLFGNCETVEGNNKFVILKAIKKYSG